MSFQPLVNGTAYAWAQIDFQIDGVSIPGIKAISYEDMQEMQDNFGAGKFPVSRGLGKLEAKASVTLEMADVEALQSASPDGRLQSYPEFPVVVAFLPDGGIIKRHILHNCRFKSNKRDMKQGDMVVDVELELQVSHITWNA